MWVPFFVWDAAICLCFKTYYVRSSFWLICVISIFHNISRLKYQIDYCNLITGLSIVLFLPKTCSIVVLLISRHVHKIFEPNEYIHAHHQVLFVKTIHEDHFVVTPHTFIKKWPFGVEVNNFLFFVPTDSIINGQWINKNNHLF